MKKIEYAAQTCDHLLTNSGDKLKNIKIYEMYLMEWIFKDDGSNK